MTAKKDLMKDTKTIEKADKRVGTEMIHPTVGKVTVTSIRVTPERTYAYFLESVCNAAILKGIKND